MPTPVRSLSRLNRTGFFGLEALLVQRNAPRWLHNCTSSTFSSATTTGPSRSVGRI